MFKFILSIFLIFSGFTVTLAQEEKPSKSVEAPKSAEKLGYYGDIVYGDADAAFEIIEFASLTCPHCAAFHANELPSLMAQYVEAGKVRFVFRNFVLNQVDMAVSVISRCRDMEFAKKAQAKLFETQASWSRAKDIKTAVMATFNILGMESKEFEICLSNQDMAAYLNEQTQKGAELYKVTGTPTIILNGKRINPTFDAIDSALKALEAK